LVLSCRGGGAWSSYLYADVCSRMTSGRVPLLVCCLQSQLMFITPVYNTRDFSTWSCYTAPSPLRFNVHFATVCPSVLVFTAWHCSPGRSRFTSIAAPPGGISVMPSDAEMVSYDLG
jgi:hypothetical protein